MALKPKTQLFLLKTLSHFVPEPDPDNDILLNLADDLTTDLLIDNDIDIQTEPLPPSTEKLYNQISKSYAFLNRNH